jgi:hypothetical protein
MTWLPSIVRIVELQAAWWATVLLARAGHDVVAILPQLAVVLLNGRRHGWWAAALQASIGMLLGLVVDGGLIAIDAIAFPGHDGHLPPPFMLSLWAGFAVVFVGPASSLATKPWLGALLGAVGGTLAYRGGASLGAMQLPSTNSWGMIAMLWAIAMPLLAATGALLHKRSGVGQVDQ